MPDMLVSKMSPVGYTKEYCNACHFTCMHVNEISNNVFVSALELIEFKHLIFHISYDSHISFPKTGSPSRSKGVDIIPIDNNYMG